MQDKISRFLGATEKWGYLVYPKNAFSLDLPGDIKDCLLFSRNVNIDEMTCEDDEKYKFSTPDYRVQSIFNRFQTRIILQRFSKNFTTERIDFLIKAAWNYDKIIINKNTAEYEPYSDKDTPIFAFTSTGGLPPTEIIYID